MFFVFLKKLFCVLYNCMSDGGTVPTVSVLPWVSKIVE